MTCAEGGEQGVGCTQADTATLEHAARHIRHYAAALDAVKEGIVVTGKHNRSVLVILDLVAPFFMVCLAITSWQQFLVVQSTSCKDACYDFGNAGVQKELGQISCKNPSICASERAPSSEVPALLCRLWRPGNRAVHQRRLSAVHRCGKDPAISAFPSIVLGSFAQVQGIRRKFA